jgi:hypothetical protein
MPCPLRRFRVGTRNTNTIETSARSNRSRIKVWVQVTYDSGCRGGLGFTGWDESRYRFDAIGVKRLEGKGGDISGISWMLLSLTNLTR